MKPLFTKSQLQSSNPSDLLPCECYHCNKIFYNEKRFIIYDLKTDRRRHRFCSTKCHYDYHKTKLKCVCSYCGSIFDRIPAEIPASGRSFCSHSCAAIYNNTHKTKGIRVSKAEKHIQKELEKRYPNLSMLFNDSTIINSELDIYIPSLKFAVEINGIFHYEPIFGKDKLNKIQNNDGRKFQACLDREIELCISDMSQMKYFKEERCNKYFNIITTIVDNKLKTIS